MMISYGEYESMIVERLKLPGYEVMRLPLGHFLNQAQVFNISRVYVMYSWSDFKECKELIGFQIFIEALRRDGDNGVFVAILNIVEKIFNWRPTEEIEGVSIVRIRYDDGVQNGWRYYVDVEFTRMILV